MNSVSENKMDLFGWGIYIIEAGLVAAIVYALIVLVGMMKTMA